MRDFTVYKLYGHILPDRTKMGRAAGEHAARAIAAAITAEGHARIILASAPSQDEMLDALTTADLDWSRVTIFHMDEYLGLPAEHPATFRAYLRTHILNRITPAAFHGIAGENPDHATECARYTALIREAPIHLCCLGIGENGHLAFNDPPVADFRDPATIKRVRLDYDCRQQQVNDRCFPTFDEVPTHALTLTIPTLMAAKTLICTVPDLRKAPAIRKTLFSFITPACPSTALLRHPDATLYLDAESASYAI